MPTFREIKDYMSMKSLSQVYNMLGYLDWKKYIKKHFRDLSELNHVISEIQEILLFRIKLE